MRLARWYGRGRPQLVSSRQINEGMTYPYPVIPQLASHFNKHSDTQSLEVLHIRRADQKNRR